MYVYTIQHLGKKIQSVLPEEKPFKKGLNVMLSFNPGGEVALSL